MTVSPFSATWRPDVVEELAALTAGLTGKQPLEVDLTALAALSGTGLAWRTGSNAWSLLPYEEGTWTPTYTPASGAFSAITYDYQSLTNWYRKIGKLVVAYAAIRTDNVSLGTASGQIAITGLPFAPLAGTQGIGMIGFSSAWINNPDASLITDRILLYRRTGGSITTANAADMTTGAVADANMIRALAIYLASS